MGLDVPTVKSLGVAALLHDIGRFLLPADFGRDYRLDAGDYDFIHLHARDGASFLAGVQGLPVIALRVALEHHIGYDGLGYPTLPEAHKPHFFSYIVGLADFVSWQTHSEAYYYKPIPMHRVIRTVIRRSGSQFHPMLVKVLVPLFGLYPHGTKVRLKSGEEALSLETNSLNLIRPHICTSSGDNNWTYKNLSSLSLGPGSSFKDEVTKVLGHKDDISAMLELLPARKETQENSDPQ